LDEAQNELRSLAIELSPPVLRERGLAAGLDWLAKRMQDQHGLHMTVEAEPLDERALEPLRDLLFQATRELLLNIVKHAGTDRAWVRLFRRGEIAHVEVGDEGKGFDPGLAEQDQGQSFGLFHIRERLRHIGGELGIESSPGEGALMKMSVPVVDVDAKADEAARKPSPQKSVASEDRVSILVVDDHQTVRDGLVQILKRQPNLRIVGQCGDGEKAVALARELHPDVIIMDVSLPGISGIEATRRIKADHRALAAYRGGHGSGNARRRGRAVPEQDGTVFRSHNSDQGCGPVATTRRSELPVVGMQFGA
jgi:CheY-like chemotaxis protein